MALPDRCEREIQDFHRFLEDWLSGRIPDDDETFGRVTAVLADPFEITSPSGETRDRAAVIDDLKRGYGIYGNTDSPFVIRIDAVRPRFSGTDYCLLTYEEHQRIEGTHTTRRSTVMFEAADGPENGVAWLHLQETWTPDGAPET